ncbi:MAG: hypothetical protein WCN27_00720 [Alphaproteobacteria bacterium]
MFYKLLLGIFIFQGTFLNASDGSGSVTDVNLQIEGSTARKAVASSSSDCGENCAKGSGCMAMFGAATMHSLAAWYAWQEIQKSENRSVQKALIASIFGNSIAAAGDAIAGCVSLVSGKGAASCIGVTYGLAFGLANIPTWVAIGFEDNTDGVQESLTKSAVLSSVAVIPSLFGICCSAVGDKD